RDGPALAARAVLDPLPGQCHRLRQLGGSLRWRGHGVPRRHRHPVLWEPWHSGRGDRDRLRARLDSPALRRRNPGTAASGVRRKLEVQSAKFKVTLEVTFNLLLTLNFELRTCRFSDVYPRPRT